MIERTSRCCMRANQLSNISVKFCDKYRQDHPYWNGKLCVRDPIVLRQTQTTNDMIDDDQMITVFSNLQKFHPDDVLAVYLKYLHRVETLIDHDDIGRQYNDLLTASKNGVLERLRSVKVDKNKGKGPT